MNLIKNIKRIILFIILAVLVMVYGPLPDALASTSSEWYDLGEFRDTTYYRTFTKWQNTYQVISNVNKEFKVDDSVSSTGEKIVDPSYGSCVKLKTLDKVSFSVNVDKTGLYYLALDYKYDISFHANPTIDLIINDESQYNEASEINLDIEYESIEREEKDKYNRYGDELLPYSNPIIKWYHNFVTDTFSESTKPNVVLLEKGLNTVTIISNQENLLVGSLYLESYTSSKSYSEYIKNHQNDIETDKIIMIQGEDFSKKNDIEVKAGFYKSYTMTPKSYKSKVLNTISGGSIARSGTKVTYTFECLESGLYSLSFKYKQNSLAGLSVGKNIYIDGEIPFKEMEDYLFPYTKTWVNYTLNNNGTPYKFYLSKGLHEITFESTSAHSVDVIDKLYNIMDDINSIGITINTITGSSSNTQISWNIVNYLPTIVEDLNSYADVLEQCYDEINALNPSSKEASEVSTLMIAAKQLRNLAKHPKKIQNRLEQLNEGSGSSYQLIGTAIGYLINQSLDFDYFVFHNDNYRLKSPNGNIFGRFFFSIQSFFYSFFDERYNITTSKDNTLDVLVSSSNLYTNIIQELTDDEFTKQQGINVKLNILSNTQSIVLNNAAGKNPDLILELDSWLPYTYALRGILEDLSKFNDFDKVTNEIYASNFTPLIYEKGVYGIPETQGMQLLFYRTDILNALGLNAPNTWEDVLKMLPTLQSYQMNFYHPLGADSAYKGFGVTSQFFYMFGSEVYTNNGFTTNINEEQSVQALKYMTDLFNIYNLPQQVSSFFEHFRSGTLPIGIGSVDLYLQLKYACPELSGQWEVLPIPGVLNENTNEIERWTTTYGKCSIMFASSKKKDAAWKFLKWWHSPETQLKYIQTIKMNLGEKYLIVPANMQTLNASPWDQQIKKQVVMASRWSRIPAITPGSYIVEREISNIWNKVVIDKAILRVAINQSVPKINRELNRKFEEFGYLKNGEIIKEYVVPNYNNLSNWVKGKEQYE